MPISRSTYWVRRSRACCSEQCVVDMGKTYCAHLTLLRLVFSIVSHESDVMAFENSHVLISTCLVYRWKTNVWLLVCTKLSSRAIRITMALQMSVSRYTQAYCGHQTVLVLVACVQDTAISASHVNASGNFGDQDTIVVSSSIRIVTRHSRRAVRTICIGLKIM